MSIRLQCANCKKRYLLSDKFAASQVDCRNCGQTISVKPRVKESVEKHESQSRLACPACTDSSLTERTLKNGVTVDSCKSCRGTWLDAGEFLQLTRNKEDATQNVLALSWGAVKSKRHCPHCQTSMSEAAFLDDETRIDFCQHCDGLWFDDGELKDSLQGLRMGLPFYSITELADSQMTKASTNLDSESKYSDESEIRCPRCNAVQFRDHGDCHACGSSMRPNYANGTSSEIPNRVWFSYLAIHVLRRGVYATVAIVFFGLLIRSALVGSSVGLGAPFLVCVLVSILWTIAVSLDFSRKVVAIQDKQVTVIYGNNGNSLRYELYTDHGSTSVSKAVYRYVEVGVSYRCWVIDAAFLPFLAKTLCICGPFERVKA